MIIWRYGRKRQVALLVFLDLFVAAQMVFLAVMLSGFIAAATVGSMSRFLRLAIIAVGGFAVLSLLGQWHVWVKNHLIQTVNLRIKSLMVKHLIDDGSLPEDASKPLSFMTNDLKQLETNGIMSEVTILEQLLTLVFAIAGAIYFDWLTTLVFVVGALLPMAVSGLTQKAIDRRSSAWSTANGQYTGSLKDLLSGLDTIRSYHANTVAKARANQSSETMETKLRKMNDMIGTADVWMSFIALTLGLLVPFGFGIVRIISGVISIASFIGIVQLSNSITNPLLTILDGVNKWNTTRQIQGRLRAATHPIPDTRSEQQLGVFQTITLHDVTLSRGGKPLLKNFSLTLKAGDKILLKAPSGFGKTTLLYALTGQQPLQGKYTINDIAENQLPARQQLDLFSLIKQQPFLFNDTLRFNLTLGGVYSQREMAEAVRRAHLDQFVAEKGWDYQCGENGANLSGGQIQRVEIARAFLVKRPVILADEATSALDDRLSDAIHDELFASGQTVIEVAHHISPAWEAKFDQVIDLTQSA